MAEPKRDSIFISFAGDDDMCCNGWISRFKEVFQDELDAQTGDHVSVFFYKETIAIGEDWENKILKNLRDRTSHLIAFISMAYLKREVCRQELQEMMDIEESLGAKGMVLPIYFIGSCRRMEDIDDPLIQRVVTRTYYDWREFRFTPPSDSEIRRMVSDIVEVILKLDSESSVSEQAALTPAKKRQQLRSAERSLKSIRGAIDPRNIVAAGNDTLYMERESSYDDVYLSAIGSALRRHRDSVVALDLDCRGRDQAQHHAEILGDRLKHLFVRVDTEEQCAEFACSDESITFFALPKGQDFANSLERFWADNGFPKVDLLYSDALYRRFEDIDEALLVIRKDFLSKNGGVVFKGFDDGTKICFPEWELMEKIIRKTSDLPIVSDRFNGRKLYSSLVLSGFTGAECFYQVNDTTDTTIDERLGLFSESFAYRLDYFRKLAGENYEDDETYLSMKHDLRSLRSLFCRDDFYYAETNIFVSAWK